MAKKAKKRGRKLGVKVGPYKVSLSQIIARLKEVEMDENKLENELQALGLNAPRLSPTMINETIIAEQYYVFPGTVMTICCLTLQNGYNIIGTSAPASPENFNEEKGKEIAKDKAREQIWALEGYLLKTKLKGKI